MRRIYETDAIGRPTGVTMDIGDADGRPPGWAPSAPPEGAEDPVWNGVFWSEYVAPAPPVPVEVSAAQAKTALYQAGIYDDVEAVLGAAPDGLVRIWWQSAQVWRRDHPYILAVATFLDPPLDDDQVDALFMAAAAVPT